MRSPGLLPLALAAALPLLGGCAATADALRLDDVKPWERDVLARDDMQPVADAMDEAVDRHLYFSKEASSGGGSVRGGGCGCN